MKRPTVKILHYTIVEMMMVVAVFMIILFMAIAAWVNSGSTAKLKNAAREVNAILNLARAKAVAERTHVGVLFSNSGSGDADNSSDPNPYSGKPACRIYYYNGSTRGGHVDFEDWNTLPAGITFDIVTSYPNNYWPGNNVTDRVAYIVFNSRGAVQAVSNMPITNGGHSITIVEGSTVSNSIPANSPHYITTVNGYTGRVTTKYYEKND